MSNELAKFEPQDMEQLIKFSTWLSKSDLLPKALRNKPADVAIVWMAGRELGFSSMQSFSSIDVIEGKPIVNAQGIVALCVTHSEVCEYFRLLESTPQKCVYETKRRGSEPVRLSYGIQDAQAAGLAGKDNWKRHPGAMLRARCSRYLACAVYPDLTKGLVTPDEAEEIRGIRAAPERDITPPAPTLPEAPAQTVERMPIESSRTEQLKEKLKARQPKARAQVIDVRPGETDEKAEARLSDDIPEPPPHSDADAAYAPF